MSIQTSQVFEYLDAHPLWRYEGSFESLLETLHHIYTVGNPIDSEAIRSAFRRAYPLEKLSPDEADALIRVTSNFCSKYELLAFSHGILVGMNLMTEINGLP